MASRIRLNNLLGPSSKKTQPLTLRAATLRSPTAAKWGRAAKIQKIEGNRQRVFNFVGVLFDEFGGCPSNTVGMILGRRPYRITSTSNDDPTKGR
jgi:hypothetical protein